MNVAILGGSFNPPHIGHALLATQVRELFKIDEVWLLPVFAHAFEKKLASTTRRLAMTRLLETNDIKTSTFELDQKKTNYTIDTLKKLKSIYPNIKFYFILGSDQLESFKDWGGWEELIKEFNLIIFPRPKMTEEIESYTKRQLALKKIPKNIYIAKSKTIVQIEISSTTIRDRIKKGLSIKYMVPDKIEKYIHQNHLYE